jgi:hypothetical protein
MSNAGLMFALTGVLIATSILNTASSGIPLFYLVLLIPLFRCFLPTVPHLTTKFRSETIALFLVVGTQIAALILTTLAQIIWLSLSPKDEILHLVARIMFLAYFVICLRYLRGNLAYATLVWTRRILIVVFFYGVYQLPAKLRGWPLFLDWLRNNKSYDMYGYNASGLLDVVRATSVYAEPSHAAVPVIVAILLNIYLPARKTSKLIGWLSIILFTAASASRAIFVSIAALILVLFMCRFRMMRRFLQPRQFAPLVTVILAFFLFPVWGFVAVYSQSGDLSQQERSGSIVLGTYMIRDAPLIGFGWNSVEKLAGSYLGKASFPGAYNLHTGLIDNMPVSYWEQAGISGLFFAILPYVLLWRWSEANLGMTWATIASLLVAAEFGGDIGYYSLTWLWIALLINMGTINKLSADQTPMEVRGACLTLKALPS